MTPDTKYGENTVKMPFFIEFTRKNRFDFMLIHGYNETMLKGELLFANLDDGENGSQWTKQFLHL